jgi:hypothetical protein
VTFRHLETGERTPINFSIFVEKVGSHVARIPTTERRANSLSLEPTLRGNRVQINHALARCLPLLACPAVQNHSWTKWEYEGFVA